MTRLLLRSLQVLLAFVAVSAVLYLGLRLYGPVKGAYWRAFRTPDLVRDSAVEQLSPVHADAQRTRLFDVWQSGRGKYGLRQTTLSIEGTPIGLILVTEDGRATLVFDYTRDAYGPRRFVVQPVEALEVGSAAAGRRGPTHHGSTRLRCTLEAREATWF